MLKDFIKKLMYPNRYSSPALIESLRKNGAIIGDDVHFYAPATSLVDINSARFIEIGSHVMFTSNVTLLAHDYSCFVLANTFDSMPRKQQKTVIGNNVFVGMNVTILMGTHIGDNVIIGAGSVVSGNIESDSVYAGNPAKKVCTLKEHYDKNCEHFIESATCYAEEFRRVKGRLPEIDEMIIYRALFCNQKELSDYANKENFRCITKKAKDNMSMPEFENKFSTVQELLEYVKNKH
ncbi:MAG: acyltransferase [bacterium]|nr:acyltransferase [bacterium]